MDIRTIYVFRVVLFIFKNSHYLQRDLKEYNLRRSSLMCVTSKPNIEQFKKHFVYLCPNIYNILPDEIKYCNQFQLYKKKVKEWLRNNDALNDLF